MKVFGKNYTAVWMENGKVKLIDQRLIPHQFKILTFDAYEDVAEAIRNMTIRGAGTIGATAGFGIALATLQAPSKGFKNYLKEAYQVLLKTRPTAVDLKHALDRVSGSWEGLSELADIRKAAVAEAWELSEDYVLRGEMIGNIGNSLLRKGSRVLTHCNAGWLALQDWGSATAPVYVAHRSRKKVFVWVDETRPRCQGANLTAWELGMEGVPHAVIADNAAGHFFRKGEVDLVIVGADRIAMNGDTANKIGTYEKAVLAWRHKVPFYVAAPSTTFDPHCPTGDAIPIEERSGDELRFITGRTVNGKISKVEIMPASSTARNPAFDVTPSELITGFITEYGIIQPAKAEIQKMLKATAK